MNAMKPSDVEQTRTPGPDDDPDDTREARLSPDVDDCDPEEAGYGYGV